MFAERGNRRDHSAIPITAIIKLRAFIRCWEKGKKPSTGLNEASMADLPAGLSSEAIQA